MFKILAVLVAFVVVIGASGGMLIGVANAAAPGDSLYGLDRGIESLRLSLASNLESAQDLQALFAQERLEEVQTLAERGDEQLLDQALQELGRALLEATGASASPEAPLADELDEDLSDYCDGTATKRHPVGEKLARRFKVDYQDIMDWACAGYGFGNIKLAYQISQSVGEDATVQEIFDLFDSGLGWGEIAQGYGLKNNSGDKDDDDDEGEDNGGSDGDGFKQPNQGAYCNGTAGKNHPTGERLAENFGVGYDDIMGWFCKGYGFGEIKLAYTIAGTNGATVDEIFAEREGGKGWGNIKKDHELKGKDKPPKDKTNNGKSPDKAKKDKKDKKTKNP